MRLVSLAHLEFGEIGRATLAAFAGFAAAAVTVHFMPPATSHSRDWAAIAAGTLAWAAAAWATLAATGSTLPAQVLRRAKPTAGAATA